MPLKPGQAALAAIAFVVLPVLSTAAHDPGPVPPCGADVSPVFPTPEESPAIASWRAAEIDRIHWIPPACTGWSASSGSRLVVAIAASFRFEGDLQSLLARAGAISALRDARYWSTTEHAWRPLALDAAALSDSDPKSRRRNFVASELTRGSQHYYWINDNRTGSVVYRLRVLERDEHRVVLARENASPVRAFATTLFEPGMPQTVEFIERRSDVWTFYRQAFERTGSPPRRPSASTCTPARLSSRAIPT
ncbi:DUF6675 family protein [Cupriavidus lacunae]|uniref:Uncharacterized protein n=1 Tax=Cupriavidus lacunae TaxID=2666307 RepID=A0A370NJG7_9BURK|nr:DUF6675 family protein [Cupriavidus lacunae]RDK05706.1 hypothetical protein DN412_35600 [Cupriavidus lacunae]